LTQDGNPLERDKLPYILALKTGEPQKNAQLGVIHEKKISWLLVNSIPLKDKTGAVYAVASSFQDITAQKQLEKQKDEFISIASHELKTTVTTINAFLQVLLEMHAEEDDKRTNYMLTRSKAQVNRLISLIRNLPGVTKIKAGKLELNCEEVCLDNIVDGVITDLSSDGFISEYSAAAEKFPGFNSPR